MPYQVSTRTIEALRAMLAQVEQQTDLAPDDPSLVTLKSILLQRVAELQAVDEAATQNAEQAALESALTASNVPASETATTLAIDLAVSLLVGLPLMVSIVTSELCVVERDPSWDSNGEEAGRGAGLSGSRRGR
jgi:hypothetical protein